MQYSVAYRVYHRPFCQPLQTHHGRWDVRSGVILQLCNSDGQVRYGEIAPLEWFGTETLQEAIALCKALSPTCVTGDLWSIPGHFPACQFGFESALETFTPKPTNVPIPQTNSLLLPTGRAALDSPIPNSTPGATFKWKIGVSPLVDELEWFDRLLRQLPPSATIRLDANGGLTSEDAARWLEHCDRSHQVEFLEQPLPPDQFDSMQRLREQFQTPIALDESVSTLDQLEACLRQGWQGVVILKAAIAGSPDRLRQLSQVYSLDLVWSSVFETAIAQRFVFERLIPSVPVQRPRALGFGVNQWFNDEWCRPCTDDLLWQSLPPPDPSSNSA